MQPDSEPKPFDNRLQVGHPAPGPNSTDGVVSLLQLQQQKSETLASLAFARYQYVDVTFAAADTDYLVPHTLTPVNPEDVDYTVMKADRATAIYDDQSSTRQPWGTGYLLLRSSAATATVRLLLIIKRLPAAQRT